ncbi:DUF3450 family protein [Phycisphaerales bacterium AB-hyl4]|uniref:DUF3450 family protein n=1 Tax=Natronomicrosphaera hydrolytica TaxID=3242702 RepID=A0ABV4U9A9_9BACT
MTRRQYWHGRRGGAAGLGRCAAVVLGLSLAWQPMAVAMADDADAVARRIAERVAELESLRAEARAERSQRAGERDALAEQVDRLQHDLRTAEAEVGELNDELEQLREQRVGVDDERAALADALDTLTGTVSASASALEAAIANGVPSGREPRRAAVQRVSEALGDVDASATQRIDALATFVDFASEELQRVDQRELRNERVAVGDRQMHAFIYRLGLVTEGFVSEDGSAVGVFDPGAGDWRLDVSGEAERLQAVIDTMRERQPPAILAVPIIADLETEQAGDS